MRISVSSDEYTNLVNVVLQELDKLGHDVFYIGPEEGESADWPEVTIRAVQSVVNKTADEAVVMCWTGTGASIAANKIQGIRAALCHDAETAKGARTWNHANVLALSLRATSEAVVKEILDAWFNTPYSEDEWNLTQIERIKDIEKKNL